MKRLSFSQPLAARWEVGPLVGLLRDRVVPVGLLLHVALIACVTAQIVLANNATTQFSQRLHNGWVQWLFPEGADELAGNPVTFPGDQYYVYQASQVNASLATLVSSYFGRFSAANYSDGASDDDAAVDAIDAYTPGDGRGRGLAPPVIDFSFAGGGGGSAVMRSPGDYAAWLVDVNASDERGWASFVQRLSALSVSAQLRAFNPGEEAIALRACAEWSLTLHFDLSARSVARVWLEDTFDVCRGGWADAAGTSPLVAVAVAVGVLAVLRQICIIIDATLTWGVLRDASAIAQAAAIASARTDTRTDGADVIDWSLRPYVRALCRVTADATLWELGGTAAAKGGGGDHAVSTAVSSGDDPITNGDATNGAPSARRRKAGAAATPAAAPSGSVSMAQAAAALNRDDPDDGGSNPAAQLLGEGAQRVAPTAPPPPFVQLAAVPLTVPRRRRAAPRPAARSPWNAAAAQRAETPLAAALRRALDAGRAVQPLVLLDALAGSPWPLVATAANALCVAFAGWAVAAGEVPGVGGRAVLVLGSALLWVSLLQYFKFNGNYYLLGRTLGLSAPMMAWNALGAVPVYLAFATAAVVLFGGVNERFDGLPRAAISLFAIANGDVVRETFIVSLAYQPDWVWGAVSQVFMYVFCATFIYAILKTTTAINEQSYLMVRPLPPGATPGARASAIPNARGGPDSALPRYALPPEVRVLLDAMQDVADAGGSARMVISRALGTSTLYGKGAP